jgi:hypothetical protein
MTPAALDNLRTEILENNWDSSTKTVLETVKVLNDMKIHGPEMLPWGYLAFPICHYLHNNKSPDRNMIRQWFWCTAFDDIDFRRADEVYSYCTDFFDRLEKGEKPALQPLELSKQRIIGASYYYKSALSRAVMAFLANQKPIDFSDPDAEVLDNVYLKLSQAPNLHHIYPQNFLDKIQLADKEMIDSLMNIRFLRTQTNIKIGDKNPLHYFKEFERQNPKRFDEILNSHLIPKDFIQESEFVPQDYIKLLNARVELFAKKIKEALPDLKVKVV